MQNSIGSAYKISAHLCYRVRFRLDLLLLKTRFDLEMFIADHCTAFEIGMSIRFIESHAIAQFGHFSLICLS